MPYEFEDELQSEAVSGRFVFEDEAPSDEPSSLTDLAVSGYHNMMASGEMVDAANQAKDINDPNFAGVERRGMDKSSFLGMSSDELRRRSTAAQPDGKQRLGLELQQTLDRSQEHSNKAGNVRLSESTDRFLNSEDNDLSSIWSDFWEAPVTIVTEISAQSLAPSVASAGGAIAGGLIAGPAGFAVGSGATSARIEYANTIKERLAESGIDMTSADSFAKAYQSNPELFQEAHEYALKRGGVIGTVDAATAGLATKTLGIGQGLTKHGTNLLAQGVVQAGGGALGEAGAQLATEGEITSPRQVAAEAAGELISAPLDVAGATIAGVRDRQANLDPANASKETTQAGLDEIRQAQADALRQQHEGVSTAADLGLKMPEQRDYSDVERPTVLRNYGPTPQRGNNEILNDIGIARRMGFDEEAQALSQARELYMQAEQAKSSGREGLAQELTKQANELHMTAIDTSNRMSDTINKFPAPYVSEGEIQGGDVAISKAQPENAPIEGQLSPEQLEGNTKQLESKGPVNRLEDQNIIYGEEPHEVTEARKQRDADNFSALYGQEGQTPYKAEAIEGELDRSNELPDNSALKLPPGTGQIDLGQDLKVKERSPGDTLYGGVGENIANRQAPRGLTLPNQPSVTQEQVIDQQRVNKPTVEQIDKAAAETNEQPSEAQIEADNYKKGRVKIAGLNITIENRKGAIRSGTDSSGRKWESKMEHHYGDIKGYKGADGDDIDVFIGNNPESDQVFIVDQVDPKTGAFDEHKVMMGFSSIEEAKAGYLANYEKNWQGAGEVSALSETDFKQWLKGDTTKPYNLKVKPEDNGFVYRPNGAPYKTAKGAQFNQAYRNNKGAKVVEVEGGYAIQLPDQEKIETQRANSQKKAKASYTRDPDPASDDLMNAIALGGGIRRDYAEGVDPADYSRRAAGIRLVFPKNSGKSLDEMTEYLRQFGYVQSVEELQSKLDSSLRGEEVLTPEAQMSKMDELQAELDQEHAPVVEGQTSEESFLSVAAEEARQAGVDENRIKAIIYANVDEGELAAAMELSNEIQRVQTEGLQARDGSEGGREVEAGFSEGRPTDAESVWGAEEDLLTSYSEGDLQAREAEQNAERDRQAKEQSEADNKAQADSEVDDFNLSGSDRDADVAASKGQGDIFSEQKPSAEDEIQSLGDTAKQRRKEDEARSDFIPPELISGDMDYLTDIEKQRLHNLKQSLPSHAEQAKAAKERLKERVATRKNEPLEKINDFGEKIGGARKDVWSGFRESLSDEIDTKTAPLSKSFPEPNYAKLAEEGADPQVLAMIALMRSSIPNKPRVKYRVSSWSNKVEAIRSFARDLMDGTIPVEEIRRQILIRKGDGDLISLAETAPALAKVNPAMFKEASKYKIASGSFSIFNGKRLEKPTDMFFIENGGRSNYDSASPSLEDVQAAYVELMNKLKPAEKGKGSGRNSAIGIYSNRRTGKVFIGWKGASGVLQIKNGFDSPKEARSYLGDNREELEAKLAEIKKTPSMRRSVNARREGPERREGNVTPEQFADEFGFRGVEFGNWVENSKRQQDLNEAYDGLIDLAEILEIPPKALSLNGELGLAFGARGKGGKNPAAAHYEAGNIVINLTKKAGPGSLAHEWWHSMDNYFSRMRKDKLGFTTNRPYALQDKSVRPEVLAAFKDVMKAINMSDLPSRAAELDKTRSKAYWATNIEMSARSFESFVISKLKDQGISNDYLANVVSKEYWDAAESLGLEDGGSYPYPTEIEVEGINKAYQALFDTIQTKETDSGVAMFSRSQKPIELKDEGDVSEVETGKPVSFYFSHNTESATGLFGIPDKDSQYGRGYEPSARYVSILSKKRSEDVANNWPGYVGGKLTFNNPLVIPNDGLQWKQTLSDSYDGKTGKALSKALIADGYDGVITTEENHITETIDLTTFDESKAKYSRSGVAGRSSNSDNASVLSVDAVRASSEAIARRLRIRGVKLSVVASEDSLPDSLKAQIAADGAEGEIKAAYHNKAIHIVADRMQSKLDIEEAILHEGAHYGGRVLFGKDMHNAYRKLWMKLGGVKGLRAKAKEGGFAKDLEPYIKTAEDLISKGEISSADRARFLVDEFLAHMNQQKAHDGITRKAMRAVKEFIGAIRNMLRKYKLMELEQMSDSDLQYLLKRITESTRDQAPDADKPHFMRVSEQEQMSMMFSDMAQALGEQPMFSRTSEAFDDLNDQQEAFLDKIGPETPVQKLKHRFEQVMDNWRLKLRQQLVDRYAPLYDIDKKAKGEDVIEESIQDSSWVLARMAQSADGALNAMLNHGRIKYEEGVIDVQDNSVGLLDTLQKLGNAAEVERFMGWIAANRAEKLMEEGRENLFSNEEIAAGIRLNEGVAENGLGRAQLYDDVFAEFQAYRDDVLKIAMDSGIISEENYSMWKDEFYVPFYRAMEDEEIKGPVAGGGLSRQQAYKKLKGGDQNLNDLLGNTLMNFNHLVTSSLKNAAASKALENAEEIGAAAEVNESARDKKQSTFVLREGEKVYYDIADPLVYRSLISMTESAIKFPGMDLMRSFKRVFTNFTTASPQFIAANLIRDSLQAAATSEVSANVPKNVLKGMKDYGVFDKTTRTRAKMLASGGAFSFGHVYGDDADAIKIRLNGELRKAQVLKDPAKALGILRKAWDKYQDVSDSFENVNRAAIFEQNQDRGQLYASFKARDLMDFSQRGMNPVVTFLIDTVPFLNARIQGLDKLYRSGAKPTARVLRGKATDADKQAAARFAAVTGALTMATIALYLHNRDDEDYRDLEDWQKDTYWFFKVGDDAFFIPKPFEVGAIATLAERAVEQMVDDSADADLFLERMGHMVSDTFSFNPIPQIFRPVVDVKSNKDSFTGRPIESMGMERLSPSLRYHSGTSDPAKWVSNSLESTVGEAFGKDSMLVASPVQVDYLVRNYFGWLGERAVSVVDTVSSKAKGENEPHKDWSEYQPMRRFYRDLSKPGYTKQQTEFYEDLKEVNRIYSDIKKLRELGKDEQALELLDESRDRLKYRTIMNRVQRQLSQINSRMKIIERQNIDSEIKRKRMDVLRERKIKLVKMVDSRIN